MGKSELTNFNRRNIVSFYSDLQPPEGETNNETFLDKAIGFVGMILGLIFVIFLFVGVPSGVIWAMCCMIQVPHVREYTECTPHETKPNTTVCELKKEYIYPPEGYQSY